MPSNRTQSPPRLVARIRSGSLGGLVASGVLSTCRWFPGVDRYFPLGRRVLPGAKGWLVCASLSSWVGANLL